MLGMLDLEPSYRPLRLRDGFLSWRISD